jgi:hypothetical protein
VDPENGSDTLLRNVSGLLPNYMGLQHRIDATPFYHHFGNMNSKEIS